ncbi:hypothetical protein BS78_05G235500 [Paspalum vaginatum]|nr:hypothetical protein BS78_05G235500 [Paspalum vaginatum]KAJ1276710.1 hypothetical protein BS78_05G235500 [Paspalum vaginatum]KAJ1276711.1 hypothetical protein BS78_05G235500 [Paspalum vaginatum]KAJ1276712.1 hypothetical protein BS78_05G235500 [Paspalum vaginatum]KAJ1276713.1 hypothetical protein BS78_05G235500 [Paspalum vaginatum]
MLAKILEIIAAHPDDHLRREVEKLVHTYRGSTEHASDQIKKERKTKKTDVASRSEVKNEKDNVPAADIKVPRPSLSDGSAKSTSAKSVIGQGGRSIANKGSPHRRNPADAAGSTKKKENRIKEIDGRNTTGSQVKIEKTNVPADCKGSLSYAKYTSVKSVNGQGLPSIVNKIISRSTKHMTSVTSIDVHPAKPWIVTGHTGGSIFIWDFQKQKTVMELQVNEEPGKTARRIYGISRYIKDTPASHWIYSVKFITQEKWLLVGDGGGYIHVYAYTGTKLSKVTKFRAHHGNSVNTLAVHPTEPYLLSSSAFGRTIRLWNWSKDWENIRTYDVKPMYPHGVLSLKFNPRDTNTFACVTKDNRVKVGNITTSGLTTKLMGPFEADYFFAGSQHLMATLSFKSPSSSEVENQIWDLDTGKVVHTLAANGHQTSCIAAHPTLPILVTALDDGTICFWDTSTYRLEESVHVTDRPAHDLALVTDTNGITRLIVSLESMIEIMEVNLPRAITSGQTGGGNYG